VPHPLVTENLSRLADGIELHRAAIAVGEHLADEPFQRKPTMASR